MRSVLASAAAIWFVVATIAIGDGSQGTIGDPPDVEVIGDPTVMAIHAVARFLFIGLAILSLALVDPAAVRRFAGR